MAHHTLKTLPYRLDSLYWAERIRQLPHTVFLDSGFHSRPQAEDDPSISLLDSRWDILTADPVEWHAIAPGEPCEPSDLIRDLEARWEEYRNPAPELPGELPFTGGLVGYFSYEFGRPLNALKGKRSDYYQTQVGLYLWAILTDHQQQQSYLFIHNACPKSHHDRLLAALALEPPEPEPFQLNAPFQPTTSPADYQSQFERIEEYILAGDCYQINLTQRLSSGYQGDLWQAYKRLRQDCPTPFSAWFDGGTQTLLSHSPERFLSSRDRQVETKPIKGTRPRGRSAAEDQQLAEALLASPKDRAENVMIVDLLRNDLGKTAVPGTVKVEKLCELESFANVHHLVSTITAQLPQSISPLYCLQEAFPGGSITGAPKRRAMEIIDELEPVERGPYCGSLFYWSLSGQLDSSIMIRTLVARSHGDPGTPGGRLDIWGGGGIVADSNQLEEYEESLTKVKRLTETLEKMQ